MPSKGDAGWIAKWYQGIFIREYGRPTPDGLPSFDRSEDTFWIGRPNEGFGVGVALAGKVVAKGFFWMGEKGDRANKRSVRTASETSSIFLASGLVPAKPKTCRCFLEFSRRRENR
jgi:hypothetical protein